MSPSACNDTAVRRVLCANLKGRFLDFTRLPTHVVLAIIALGLLASLLRSSLHSRHRWYSTDSSGAVIPAVKMTATNPNTELPYTTVSNARRDFIISSSKPGITRLPPTHRRSSNGQYRTLLWLSATDSGQTRSLSSELAHRALK